MVGGRESWRRGGGRGWTRVGWRLGVKGTRPSRPRPGQAVAVAETAGGSGRGAGDAGSDRSRTCVSTRRSLTGPWVREASRGRDDRHEGVRDSTSLHGVLTRCVHPPLPWQGGCTQRGSASSLPGIAAGGSSTTWPARHTRRRLGSCEDLNLRRVSRDGHVPVTFPPEGARTLALPCETLTSRASRGGHSLPGSPRDARDAPRTAAPATDRRSRPVRHAHEPSPVPNRTAHEPSPADPVARVRTLALRLPQPLEPFEDLRQMRQIRPVVEHRI